MQQLLVALIVAALLAISVSGTRTEAGSLHGRVFFDCACDGKYNGVDTPLRFPVIVEPQSGQSSDDLPCLREGLCRLYPDVSGRFALNDIPTGSYRVRLDMLNTMRNQTYRGDNKARWSDIFHNGYLWECPIQFVCLEGEPGIRPCSTYENDPNGLPSLPRVSGERQVDIPAREITPDFLALFPLVSTPFACRTLQLTNHSYVGGCTSGSADATDACCYCSQYGARVNYNPPETLIVEVTSSSKTDVNLMRNCWSGLNTQDFSNSAQQFSAQAIMGQQSVPGIFDYLRFTPSRSCPSS